MMKAGDRHERTAIKTAIKPADTKNDHQFIDACPMWNRISRIMLTNHLELLHIKYLYE